MRPTGMPVQSATTVATAWSSTAGRISGRLALQRRRACSASSLQLGSSALARSSGDSGAGASAALRRPGAAAGAASAAAAACVGAARRPALAGAQLGAKIQDAVDDRLLLAPARRQLGEACLLLAEQRVALSLRSATGRPIASSRAMMSSSISSASIRALAVLDLGRRRVLAHRDARARRVEQAHGLVRQLARRDVAMRQLDRGLDAPRRGAARDGASRGCSPRRAA